MKKVHGLIPCAISTIFLMVHLLEVGIPHSEDGKHLDCKNWRRNKTLADLQEQSLLQIKGIYLIQDDRILCISSKVEQV